MRIVAIECYRFVNCHITRYKNKNQTIWIINNFTIM